VKTYVATGDPLDKAGSYGIQNVPKHFITKLEGSLTNVIGLPMESLMDFLKERKWTFN
jgi:septum formation protein